MTPMDKIFNTMVEVYRQYMNQKITLEQAQHWYGSLSVELNRYLRHPKDNHDFLDFVADCEARLS